MMASPTGWDSTNLHPCYSPERRASLALSPTKLERLELERSNSSKPNVDLLHPTSDVFHSTPFQSKSRCVDSWTSYRNGANPMVAYGPGDPRLPDEQTNFSHYMLVLTLTLPSPSPTSSPAP